MSTRFAFPHVAQHFHLEGPEARAEALEFLTAPRNQNSQTRKSQAWDRSRTSLVMYNAYLYTLAELAGEKMRQSGVSLEDQGPIADSVIEDFSKEATGFMHPPESTFQSDTVDHFRKCDETLRLAEHSKDLYKLYTIYYLACLVCQYYIGVIAIPTGGERTSDVMHAEADRLCVSYLDSNDRPLTDVQPQAIDPLSPSSLGLGDIIAYTTCGKDRRLEIVEVIHSARRGLVFGVECNDEGGVTEYQILESEMEEILKKDDATLVYDDD